LYTVVGELICTIRLPGLIVSVYSEMGTFGSVDAVQERSISVELTATAMKFPGTVGVRTGAKIPLIVALFCAAQLSQGHLLAKFSWD
jgi:hypothetical protein